MKRLLLLSMALFVTLTLQAQVACYKYEYSHTKHKAYSKGKTKYTTTVEPSHKGKTLHLAIDRELDKGAQPIRAIYPALYDGRYRSQQQAKIDEYNNVFSFSIQGVKHYITSDSKEVRVHDGLMTHYYHRTRIFKAQNMDTLIHKVAPHSPRFMGNSKSHLPEFRKWFALEMPEQDDFDNINSMSIIIEKNGSVTLEKLDADTLPNEQLTQQVTDVLTRSPKWTPAYEKDGKTPIRYRIEMENVKLRLTPEGLKKVKANATQQIKNFCELYNIKPKGVYCCIKNIINVGDITLEELGKQIHTASRPVVIVTISRSCRPALQLMTDWNTLLKAYEGKYDLYLVLSLNTREERTITNYSKAFRTSTSNPSVLFVYNKYGMSEERLGYDSEKALQFIEWFDAMMQKSSF